MKKLILFFILFLSACASYKGGTMSDGTSLVIGLKTPVTSSGTTTLQIFSYINGLIISWENDVDVEIERTSVSNTSACGIWQNATTNSTHMTLNKKTLQQQ